MKKYFLIILILIVILITIITSVDICKKEKSKKNIVINDIDYIASIRIKDETEGGYIYYKTEDKELIKKVIVALKNIQIGEKVDVNFNDDGRYYIIEYKDGETLSYYFQNNYYNKDNINYKTYNYDDLKKIKIPEENF